MPKVQRVGDLNDAAAPITSSLQSTVYVNGELIAVDGSPVAGHEPGIPPHAAPVTANGSSTVFIEGYPVNREGDADSCGHVRVDGVANFLVG